MITSTWDGGVSALVVSWLPGVQNGRGIAMALYNDEYEAAATPWGCKGAKPPIMTGKQCQESTPRRGRVGLWV